MKDVHKNACPNCGFDLGSGDAFRVVVTSRSQWDGKRRKRFIIPNFINKTDARWKLKILPFLSRSHYTVLRRGKFVLLVQKRIVGKAIAESKYYSNRLGPKRIRWDFEMTALVYPR